MKRILLSILLGGVIAIAGTGCEDFIEGYDKDPNNPLEVSPSVILPAAQLQAAYGIGGQVANISSVWMQQHAGVSRQSAAIGRYQVTETDFNQYEENLYPGSMNDLFTIRTIANENGYGLYAAIADILMAYTLGITTDFWGDVPYDEAFQPLLTLTPNYQSQEVIYDRIFETLDRAINTIESGELGSLEVTGDLVHNGDASAWLKTAYALKARHLMQLSATSKFNPDAVADALSKAYTSNDDNAMVYFGTIPSEQNPMYSFDDQRANDTRMGKFLVDLMLSNNDPRLSLYADTNEEGSYSGAPAGVEDESVSQLGDFWAGPASPVAIITYPELLYIEAELMERQSGDGDDKSDEALLASLDLLGLQDDPNLESDVDPYEIFVDSQTGNDQGLTEILTAKYVALYQQPQVFNDWRRTGIPALQPAVNNTTNGTIPTRFLYSDSAEDYNPSTPDVTIVDKVWWDQD